MLKKIIVLLFMFIPMVQPVLDSLSFGEGWGEAFAQVVIKDEIVLDETDLLGEGILMPFYGKVSEATLCQQALVGSGTRKELIIGGVSHLFGSCQNLECPGDPCFCSAGIWENTNPGVYTALAGTEINTRFTKCINGQQLIQLQHYFQIILPIDADITYETYARINENDPWTWVGYMNFDELDPQGCDGLAECGYHTPEFSFIEIESPTYTIPGNNTVVEACTTDIAGGQVGGMKMADWHVPEGYIWNLYPCANPTNGRVRFPFKFLVGGVEKDIVPYVYLVSLCENNGSYEIIDSKTHMMMLINSGQITGNDFCNLLHDICSSYGSDPNNPGYQPLIKFVLKEVVMAHERMHFDRYDSVFRTLLPDLHRMLNAYEIECSTYISDPDGSKNLAKEIFTKVFDSIINDVERELDEYGRDIIEYEILTSKDQWDRIKPYYNALWTYMNEHNIECEPIDECDNFLMAFN